MKKAETFVNKPNLNEEAKKKLECTALLIVENIILLRYTSFAEAQNRLKVNEHMD